MISLNTHQKASMIFSILMVCCLGLMFGLFSQGATEAQEAMKPKGKIRCWIECCPLKITCEWDIGAASATRRNAPSADVVVRGDQLMAEFKPTGDQKAYEVKSETKLDAKTAEVLGFKEVTMLPGQYPLTRMANGMAKVSIKVKTVAADKKKANPSN